MTLNYQKINEENIKTAAKIQYSIFPGASAYSRYLEELENKNILPEDFLILYKNEPIGIVGFYELEKYKDTIWLSWFGVIPKYRFQGFGAQIFNDVLKMAKKYNKKFLRLYTFEKWNADAQKFYKKHMQSEEYYTNPKDNQKMIKDGKMKIFGYSLCNDKITLWNNKYLDLYYDEALNNEGIKLMKRDKLL